MNSMRNIKILIEYDGTKFCGWQYQPHVRTIQATLQDAVHHITQERVVVEGAGRTDTGVHARGQVGNFRISKPLALFDLAKGLNAVLPPDVRIVAIEAAPPEFHSRFSAKERRYRYTLTRQPTALHRNLQWFYPHPLDIDQMARGCAHLVGEKSFRSFCLSRAEVNHYRCDVRFASWHLEADTLVFDIHANRFLHSMVRSLVGTFVQIGRGRLRVEELPAILEKEDRRLAAYTAPACGLCLEAVLY